jgi:hypothetical protein
MQYLFTEHCLSHIDPLTFIDDHAVEQGGDLEVQGDADAALEQIEALWRHPRRVDLLQGRGLGMGIRRTMRTAVSYRMEL